MCFICLAREIFGSKQESKFILGMDGLEIRAAKERVGGDKELLLNLLSK